jgi:DNA-binding GntR family transcriptional regulator
MDARRDGQTGPRPLRVIAQPGLTQTTYKLLRDKIANHDYAPGERLQLDALAMQLAAEGLVEIRPRRGTFVAQVDRQTVAELYQVRLMIDTSVGRLLARQLTAAQVRMLARLFDKLSTLVDGDTYVDYGAYLERDRAFHSAIIGLLGNARLAALYEDINLPLWLVRAQEHAGTPHDAQSSLAEHRAILQALAAGDPRAAGNAMAAHIESSLAKLGRQLTV